MTPTAPPHPCASGPPRGCPRPVARPVAPPAGALWRGFATALLGALLALAPATAGAQDLQRAVQPPDADWRTLSTEHFRVHYPRPAEAWARRAAARLEAIRAAVAAEVGYAPTEVVDVVVSDPVARPNGFALPFLGWPRMVLWTSPPGADSVLAHYRDWAEVLIVHEDTHLVHLLRPSRNPLRRTLSRLLPVGPVVSAPRWATEGYATLVEGRLTGAGRPNSDLRAAVLRRWAQAGKLPPYGRLAADPDAYLGESMAYLAGSAYLAWLEERSGEGSLRDLWARLTARRHRGFDEAFRGVFGDTPADLWDRFRAELTWRAVEAERRLEDGAGFTEGELWLDLGWHTGAPAVSPDGSRLAVVQRHRDDPPVLGVYATAVDEDALEARREAVRRAAELDPEDVPARDPGPPPRERLHALPTLDGAAPSQPRWLPGGDALLLVRFLPDGRGRLHPDLFRWRPAAGELHRLTRGADVRDPDPAPDGTWAVAVRNRNGASSLVRVELATGAVTPLTEPSVEAVVDSPRLSADGRRLAWVRHRSAAAPDGGGEGPGGWALVVRDLAGGGDSELPVPAGATVASPAWGRGDDDASLYAVVGTGGFIDVFRYRPAAAGSGDAEGARGAGDADRGERTPTAEAGSGLGAPHAAWVVERVTRTRGAALAPAPTAGGGGSGDGPGENPGLFFLSLQPDGLELRRLALDGSARRSSATESAGEAPAPASPETAAGTLRGEPAEDDPFAPPAGLDDRELLAPAVRPPQPPEPPPFAVAELPPARPYGLGPRRELLTLTGGSSGPGGDSFEVGVRSGDLLGRLDLVATGALGSDGGAEGASVAAAWRGGAVELGAHLVALRQRPSRHRLPVGGAAEGGGAALLAPGALDLERSGVELAARWLRRAGGGPLRLTGGAWAGRTEPVATARPTDEASLFAEAGWSPRWSRGDAALGLGLSGRLDLGDANDADGAAHGGWHRARGRLALRAGYGDTSLSASWVGGRVDGDPPPWQLFRVGGAASSLRPSSLAAPLLTVPALPAAALVGEEVTAQRVELGTPLLPLPLFWSRHRVESEEAGESGWVELAGAEWHGRLGPVPLLRLPELEITLGAAEILSGTREGEREAWAALTWRP